MRVGGRQLVWVASVVWAAAVGWLAACSEHAPPRPPAGVDDVDAAVVAPRATVPAFHVESDGVVTSDSRRPVKVRLTREGAAITRERVQGSVKLHVASVGRSELPQELTRERAPEIVGDRVQLARAGVVEWYALDARGVEQGFRVETCPSGEGPLIVRVAIEGFAASASNVDGELDLRAENADAPSFRYGALAAADANGASLAATMSAESAHVIRLEVTDSAAAYPITIDPLVWGLRTRLVALNASTEDYFGTGVAIAGDVILAGRSGGAGTFDLGAVEVFRRGATGWAREASINPPYVGAWLFGVTLAIAPDLAFVTGAGAAYAYERKGSSWTLQQGLPTDQPTPFYGAYYSPFVYSDGTAVLLNRTVESQLGAPEGGIPATADVYREDGGIWEIAETITTVDPISIADPPNAGNFTHLGGGLAADGSRLVIGTGTSALVYRKSETGAYLLEARIPKPDAMNGFGTAVALSGTTLLVGSTQERAAYFYVFAGNTWTLQQKVVGVSLPAPGIFGYAVALANDTAWIGDPFHVPRGIVYRYQRSGEQWSLDEAIESPGTNNGRFGLSIAADANAAVISAAYEGNSAGAVYVYELASALGDACAAAQTCISGFCVQGVCCDSACDNGNAESCSTCKGTTAGTCSPAEKGTECRPGVSTCDVNEHCDGVSRACPLDAILANGSSCDGGTCLAGACVPAANQSPEQPAAPIEPQLSAGGCSASGRRSSNTDDSLPLICLAGMLLLLVVRRRKLATCAVVGTTLALSLNGHTQELAEDDSVLLTSAGVQVQLTAERSVFVDLETKQSWDFSFVGFGRAGAVRMPGPGSRPHRAGGRVTRASAEVVEWYELNPHGIEHGFDVTAAPPGDGSLVVRLNVSTGRPLQKSSEGYVVEAPGPGIAYGRLEARDADGVPLDSELALLGNGTIEIRVDDAHARYPLVIDPLVWRERQVLQPTSASPPRTASYFGDSISIDGHRALIGQPGITDPGVAYVYTRAGNDWMVEATLASPAGALPTFGAPCAISGTHAIVAAPPPTGLGNSAVFAFERVGAAWTYVGSVVSPTPALSQGFGSAVAVDGDDLAIGAPREGWNADGTPNAEIGPDGYPTGAVYLYRHLASGWTFTKKLRGLVPEPAHFFGGALAMRSGQLLVGGTGGYYYAPVWVRDTVWFFGFSGNAWSVERVDGAAPGIFGFGATVATDGVVAVVGSPFDSGEIGVPSKLGGAVQVYSRATGTWTNDQRLVAPDESLHARFGSAVAVDGGRVVVGARSASGAVGEIYLFDKTSGSWTVNDSLHAIGDTIDGEFGAGVAIADDAILVASPNNGTVTVLYQGFEGTPCASGDSCASGACIDGVCCSSRCGGNDPSDCLACSVAAGAAKDGTCGPVLDARTCRAARSSCDLAEFCDGVSPTCPDDAIAQNGVSCEGGSCSAGICLADIPPASADAGVLAAAPEPPTATGCSMHATSKSPTTREPALLLLLVAAAVSRRRRA